MKSMVVSNPPAELLQALAIEFTKTGRVSFDLEPGRVVIRWDGLLPEHIAALVNPIIRS
jgi:hypothetical protein